MSVKVALDASELPEILRPFVNKKGILEIITRNANGTYKPFYDVIISAPETSARKKLQERIMEVNSNRLVNALGDRMNNALSMFTYSAQKIDRNLSFLHTLSEKQLNIINQLSCDLDSVQGAIGALEQAAWIGNAISLVNLGVTIAGFVVINQKLNVMNGKLDEIKGIVDRIEKSNKEYHIDATYTRLRYDAECFFKKVAAEQKINRDECEKLLGDFSVFLKNVPEYEGISIDEKCMIIYSLLPIFVRVLVWFIEQYYDSYVNEKFPPYEYCQQLLTNLSNKAFSDGITDFYYLERNASNQEVINILNQQFLVNCNLMLQLNDTMELLKLAGNVENYKLIKAAINDLALKRTEDYLEILNSELDADTAASVYRHSIISTFGKAWEKRADEMIQKKQVQATN